MIVARVEGPPAVLQIHLEPGTEIHRGRRRLDTDVAEITGGIAGRNVQRTAEGNRQVLKIPADADPLLVDIECRSCGPGVWIAERHMRVHPIAHRLHPGPASRGVSEQVQRFGRQQIDFAETARHQEAQRLGRQFLDRHFPRADIHIVRHPRVLDDGGIGEAQSAGRGKDPGTEIPK